MSYQALYRVWRPQTFDDMVGQDAIKETLKNAVKNQQISHAYLFTGPRGTGKTSAAKILAKAVNCLDLQDGNPCNQCEICQLINEGQLSEVIEIDAASNNGVDEIRNLRDSVRYAATQATYKVYIIDEVHMLTTGAFNALLKTLEEPPERVVFILATTEPHKIPATILSRVQRFDFQRISEDDLIQRMAYILNYHEIPYQDEALSIIARAANGGMRDSLSLLDQALSYSRQEVNLQSALQVSGSLNQKVLVEYILAIYHHQSEEALEIVRQQLQLGKQSSRIIEELILISRDLLLSHHLQTNRTLLNDDEIEEILADVPDDYYYQLIEGLNETQSKMRLTAQPDLYLEVMTIKLSQGNHQVQGNPVQEDSVSSQELVQLSRLVRHLEQEVMELKQNIAQFQTQRPNGARNDLSQTREEELVPRQRPAHLQSRYQLEVNKIYQLLNDATSQFKKQLDQGWTDIIGELAPPIRVKFANTEPLASGNGRILIGFANEIHCGEIQSQVTVQESLSQAIETIIGQAMQPVFVLAKEWPSIRKNYMILRKENGNQPISIPEEELEETNQEEDNQEIEASTELTQENIQEDQVPPVQISSWRDEELDNIEIETESQSETSDSSSEITEAMSKTIDLFGRENVNIYYDK